MSVSVRGSFWSGLEANEEHLNSQDHQVVIKNVREIVRLPTYRAILLLNVLRVWHEETDWAVIYDLNGIGKVLRKLFQIHRCVSSWNFR